MSLDAIRTIVCETCGISISKRMPTGRKFCSSFCANRRPRSSFCPKDHDKELVGRNKKGRCRECVRAHERTPEYLARRRELSHTPAYRQRQRDQKRRRYTDPVFHDLVLQQRRLKYSEDDEYRETLLTRKSDYRVSDKGIRYRLLVENPRRAAQKHIAVQANLEKIFEEVNEVLAG